MSLRFFKIYWFKVINRLLGRTDWWIFGRTLWRRGSS